DSSVNLRTEQLLCQLALIDQLVLIITSRGTLLPNNARWTNRRTAELDTLAIEAACQSFTEISCQELDSPDERNALGELLRAVDCVPLAVSLLARLHEPPSTLLRQWKAMQTELLQADSHDGHMRELSVEVSIQVSLDFLPCADADP